MPFASEQFRRISATVDPCVYAEGLYRYAARRLEPSSLRSWMVQRLVVDLALDHALAMQITAEVLDHERCGACGHELRERERVHRFRAISGSVRALTTARRRGRPAARAASMRRPAT